MTKYILTDEAMAHINNIRDYTRNRWGKQQVRQYLSSLRESLNQLSENPLMGALRFKEENIYSFSCASHTVYYTIQKECIVILAILHQSMTPEIHLNR
jgi:toxin ParE1/3/4